MKTVKSRSGSESQNNQVKCENKIFLPAEAIQSLKPEPKEKVPPPEKPKKKPEITTSLDKMSKKAIRRDYLNSMAQLAEFVLHDTS